MKTKITLALITTLIGFTSPAKADQKNYSIENQKFTIDLPTGWKDLENLGGSPLTFFGPESKNGPRTVILISPTGKEDTAQFFKGMKNHVAEYKVGREDWLKGTFGKSISYDPYKEEKWSGIEQSRTFGYHYELPEGKFYERSSYILCGGNKVFYIKSLVPEEFESAHNSIVEQTIKSLSCEKSPVKTAKN